MSTIAKLDRNVRLDRYLRRNVRREMLSDVRRLKAMGSFREAVLVGGVLAHIEGICRDSSRTGARKDAILTQLGVFQ